MDDQFDGAVAGGVSVDSVGSAANRAGFVRLDPDYNAQGELPKKGSWNRTEVDVIGVPAIGVDPVEIWTTKLRFGESYTLDDPEKPNITQVTQAAVLSASIISPAISPTYPVVSRPSVEPLTRIWIIRDIRKAIPMARVLLYDHGEPEEGDMLKGLSLRFLECLRGLRKRDNESRPFFLIGHSTGGLVAKLALILADRGSPEDRSLVADCYGISFFGWYAAMPPTQHADMLLATPHKGSSYLSQPAFTTSICKAMSLKRPLPETLRNQLQINSELLRSMASRFKSLAADLKIWTFYETEDTDLTIPSTGWIREVRLLAPIASIKSAILDLYHEVDYPLLTDHVGCASFSEKNTQTKEAYLHELSDAATQALKLSDIKHNDLKLKEKVKIEIHGFYEGAPQTPGTKAPIRLLSTRKTLRDFKLLGPSKCLEQRLQDLSGGPRPNQQLRRATSLDGRMPGNGTAMIPNRTVGVAPTKLAGDSVTLKPPTSDPLMRHRTLSRLWERGSHLLSTDPSPQKGPSQPQTETAASPTRRESVPNLVIHNTSDDSASEADDPGTTQGHLPGQRPTEPTVKLFPSLSAHGPDRTDSAELSPDSKSPLAAAGQWGNMTQSLLSPNSGIANLTNTSDEKSSEQRNGPSKTVILPAPQFVKPSAASRKLTWIHMPFNNPTWVLDVLERIATDCRGDFHERLLDSQHWTSKHVQRRHPENHACFVKPSCSFVPPEQGPAGLQISLYLPYLHWDTYKRLVKRRHLVKRRMSHGRSRPAPEDISKMELEHRVAWAFLGHDPPFNCRRTLDQFGYPNLHDTRARDDDQMLYKMTKKRQKSRRNAPHSVKQSAKQDGEVSDDEQQVTEDQEKADGEDESQDEDLLDGTVLMVDQLWLWVVSDETTVTFFPRRQSKPIEGRLHQQADLRNSIYNEVNGDLSCRCENSLDLAALVTLHAVTVLFEHSSHKDLEVFRIFEESISILIEKMTESFKNFRLLGFRDKSIDSDSENRKMSIKERHKREGELSEKQNREDTSAMLELRDIDDELSTLKKLFKQQKETITQMLEIYQRPDCCELSANGKSILNDALEKLKEYIYQVDQMLDGAKRTRKDFEKLLDLKQRQANVDEARLARYHADLASMQSRAVMIFTVFSVIFLPLTFFTGLFGMNIREWSGTPTNVSWHTVTKLSIPLSFGIIFTALGIALSPSVRKSPKRLAKVIQKLPAWIDRAQPSRVKKKKKGLVLQDADFWEGHVDRRENAYRIPSRNRWRKKGKKGGGGERMVGWGL